MNLVYVLKRVCLWGGGGYYEKLSQDEVGIREVMEREKVLQKEAGRD